jgi:hypothetical protein
MKQKNMNAHLIKIAFVILIPLIVSGCYSCLKVRKITSQNINDVKGIRYSLPKPFLMVKPSETGDGSFTVEVVYLPDESQTYAVDAKTGMGSHTLTVELNNSLLKKISWSKDQTAVPSEAIRIAGQLSKSEFDRRKEEKSAQETEAKAALEKVKTLEKEVRDKQLALELANTELVSLENSIGDEGKATPEQKEALRLARLAVKKAQIELEAKEIELKEAQDSYSDFTNALNKPKETEGTYGPMFYEIVDTVDYRTDQGRIELKPVEWKTLVSGSNPSKTFQEKFETVTTPKPIPETPQKPSLTFKGTEIFAYTGSNLVIKRTLSRPVIEFISEMSKLEKYQGGVKKLKKESFLNSRGRNLNVTLKSDDVEVGKYKLYVMVKWGDDLKGVQKDSVHVDFEVVLPEPTAPPQLTTQGIEVIVTDDSSEYFILERKFTGKIKSLKFHKSYVEKQPSSTSVPPKKLAIKNTPITMTLSKEQELMIKIGKGMEPGFFKLYVLFDYNEVPGTVKESWAVIDLKVPK